MQEVQSYYYQDGNTVRKANPASRPYRNLPTRQQREAEKKEAAIRNQRITERRNLAAVRKNRRITAYLIIAICSAVTAFVFFVSLQNEVTTRLAHIASLENELSELNAENNAAESRIATSTNLSDIKDKAMNELGMVYANSSQIVYYNVDSSDYMNQYYDIP